MSSIYYNRDNNKVKQFLGNISSDDLEGTFQEAIEKLQEIEKYYIEKFITSSTSISSNYIDDCYQKTVTFDRIFIEMQYDHDGNGLICIMGERDFTKEEDYCVQNKEKIKKQEEEKIAREQYELLKKRFGGNL